MPIEPPWTNVGNLQSDVCQMKTELKGKANGYEVSSLNGRVEALVHAVADVSTVCDGILDRLETLEERKEN